MAISIKNEQVEDAVRKLCSITGESLTDAVRRAVEARLTLVLQERGIDNELERAREFVKKFDALPVLDSRSADEILGYDENGLPR